MSEFEKWFKSQEEFEDEYREDWTYFNTDFVRSAFLAGQRIEREACAEVALSRAKEAITVSPNETYVHATAKAIAEAIRKRGKR